MELGLTCEVKACPYASTQGIYRNFCGIIHIDHVSHINLIISAYSWTEEKKAEGGGWDIATEVCEHLIRFKQGRKILQQKKITASQFK